MLEYWGRFPGNEAIPMSNCGISRPSIKCFVAIRSRFYVRSFVVRKGKITPFIDVNLKKTKIFIKVLTGKLKFKVLMQGNFAISIIYLLHFFVNFSFELFY